MSEELSLPQLTRARREACFERMTRECFDVLVVGGGITGAAVARHAACSGFSVALVEQGDFASGTSSRSSRLIHGGLRYLKQGQVGLVYRSQRAQSELARLAPHLAHPLDLLFPLYQKTFASRFGHSCGMLAYNALQPLDSKSRHARLSAEQLLEKEPLLASTELQGGFVCREYLTHDARLVLETLLAAERAGTVAINYARVQELLLCGQRVVGASVSDALTGRTVEIRARVLVNATGPWADGLMSRREGANARLRLSKGVHIIIPRARLPLSHAVIFFSPRDKRALVAIPAENFVIVGPTETEYFGAPGRVLPEREDVDYLLEALRAFFSALDIERADLVAARAGLRPLYDKAGRAPGEVSRSYHIEWEREGLLSVLGGKLTLHRHAAQVTTSLLARELKMKGSRSARSQMINQPLPGALWKNASPAMTKNLLLEMGVEEESAHHLLRTYGSRAALFHNILAAEPELARRVTPALLHIAAEAPFSIRHEWAVTPQDFFERRTDLALSMKATGASVPRELMRFWRAPAEKKLRAEKAEEVLV
ncbi:MAG TPA: glycerol-3-phosphate dehydrogenase/oxidase [Pyrinomonadaceae bacterium]